MEEQKNREKERKVNIIQGKRLICIYTWNEIRCNDTNRNENPVRQ